MRTFEQVQAERIAALEAELAEASLNGDAIMEARAYLVEHLGKECEQPFFDDCIHNAVAITLKAKEKLAAKDAEIAELKAEAERVREASRKYTQCWKDVLRQRDELRTEVSALRDELQCCQEVIMQADSRLCDCKHTLHDGKRCSWCQVVSENEIQRRRTTEHDENSAMKAEIARLTKRCEEALDLLRWYHRTSRCPVDVFLRTDKCLKDQP